MIEKLKEAVDLRLGVTVALGVFGGLFVYRLFMWTIEWWRDLRSDAQESYIVVALIMAATGFVFYILYRFLKPHRKAIMARAAHAVDHHPVRITLCLGALTSVALLLSATLAAPDINVTPQSAQPTGRTSIAQQMLQDGSLPDKPLAIPSDDAAIAKSINAYTQRELERRKIQFTNPILYRQLADQDNRRRQKASGQ